MALVISAVVGPVPLVPVAGTPVRPALAAVCGTALDASGLADATAATAAVRDAVAAAQDADPGCDAWTVALTGTFELTEELVHAAAVPLRIVGPVGDRATLRSDGTTRILTLRRPGRTVELVRVELRGGAAAGADLDGVGGAVGAEIASLAHPGPSRVTVRDALLIENSALAGGAIAADEVVLVDVDVVANTAPSGGAIDTGTLVADRVQFLANTATLPPGQGGAVRAGGDVHVTTVTFSGNAALVGGSVWLSGLGDPILRATATTFAEARADVGGHVAADLGGGGRVRVVLRGTVLTGVAALTVGAAAPSVCAAVVGTDATEGQDAPLHSVAVDASCPGAAVADVGPLLVPLGGSDGTVAGRARLFLPAAGPLLDVGPCGDVWPAVDARGLARPQPAGGACDVGAVERAATSGGPAGGSGPDPGSDPGPGPGGAAGVDRPRPTAVPTGSSVPPAARPWGPLRRRG